MRRAEWSRSGGRRALWAWMDHDAFSSVRPVPSRLASAAGGGLFAADHLRQPGAQGRRRQARGRGAALRRRCATKTGHLCAPECRARRAAGRDILLWRQLEQRDAQRLCLCRPGTGGTGFRNGHPRLPAGSRHTLSRLRRGRRSGGALDARAYRRVRRRSRQAGADGAFRRRLYRRDAGGRRPLAGPRQAGGARAGRTGGPL